MVKRNHPKMAIGTQCQLPSISRLSYHHVPKGEAHENLILMRLINEQIGVTTGIENTLVRP